MYRWTDNLEVISYSNSDFASCVDSQKSTSGYIFMFTCEVVSQKSATQTLIATSTIEAEFVSCFKATLHGAWLKSLLKIVDLITRPLRISCGNSTTVFMAKNNKSGGRRKHIDIKYLVIKKHIFPRNISEKI